ncbi:MAG TPA: NAD-dependent succinate-semialdehyde dehydrogenase [Geobacteraceae bacterium]
MALESINPATGELLEAFEEWHAAKTESVVADVHGAWLDWRLTSFAQRADLMKKAAAGLRGNSEEYARMMALEMGKPIAEGRGEVEKCAWVCDYYAGNASRFLAPEPVEIENASAYVAFRPLGTVLAVMPWNFPFWQVFRFAAPALMAGNTALLKHSSNVPRCALAIEEVFRRAGFPANVFRTLMVSSRQVDAVIEDSRVAAVTLTGSNFAGSRVAAAAGRMLKKSVLELGGSDPFIVLADADLEEAARTAARARCINSGQSCIAAKRFIVLDAVYDAFLEHFKKAMAALVVGDPLEEATQVGPQAREDLMDELHGQVKDAVAAGAQVVLGGRPLERQGYFYPPTILAGVKPGMKAYHEELFGPVASVIKVGDPDQAVTVANDSPFGLGGSVWTGDRRKGEEVAARLETGCVFVNGLVKSDPRLPFGGVKGSGYGRELSHYGIREFVNIQTVMIA